LCYLGNSVNGKSFQPIVNQIITEAEKIGIKVNSITSDMGSSNKAMWTACGINCQPGSKNVYNNSTPRPIDPERKLYFMPDVPHLFKNTKQSLLNNKFFTLHPDIVKKYNLPSDTVQSKHIEELARHQDDLELKLVRKLNVEDFKKPDHFDKMKVSKSTAVLNRDVSGSLKYLVSTEEFDQCYITTSWFVEQVLFNICIYIY